MCRKHCTKCGKPLYGRRADVYVMTRKDGLEERQCRPCKLAQVAARHRYRMAHDREYAEASHRKRLAYLEERRQFAIQRWEEQHA